MSTEMPKMEQEPKPGERVKPLVEEIKPLSETVYTEIQERFDKMNDHDKGVLEGRLAFIKRNYKEIWNNLESAE